MRRILAALLIAILFALLWATAFSAELEQVWVQRVGEAKAGPKRTPVFGVAAGVDGRNRVYAAFETGSPGTVDGLTAAYEGGGASAGTYVYRGAENGDDRPKDLLALPEGGYILTGETDVAGEPHLVIARYTAPSIASAWEHVLQGSGFSGGAALCPAGLGRVAVAGSVYSQETGSDYYVAVYEVGSGRLVWESRFDGGGSGEDYSRRVAADAQGNVYVTGYSTRWRSPSIGSVVEIVVAKLAAADGHILWKSVNTRTAGAIGYDYPHGLAVDRQGNAIVTGQEWSGTDDRMITVKYLGGSGAILWVDRAEEQQRGVLPGRGAAVAVTSNGDVVVTGTRSVRTSTASSSRTEFVTVRYSGADGSTQWVRSLSGQGFEYGAGYDVVTAGDLGIWVTGIVSQAGQTDFYTARLDDKGQILAASSFDTSSSGDDDFTRGALSFHDGHKLVRMPDGGVVLVGNYTSGGSSEGVLLKYRYSQTTPTVTTGPATNISNSGAVLNATVTGRGKPGTAWIEWGNTTAYGRRGRMEQFPQTGSFTLNEAFLNTDTLQPHVTCNFRVVASTFDGMVYGANRTFVTNTAPEAKADLYHCKPDVELQEFAVLLNDLDADRDKLEIIATTNGAHGAVSIGAGGVLQYSPHESFQGSDSFSYTIADGYGGQATATVSLVNNEPVAKADIVETAFEQAISIPVMGNDSDADSDPLKIRSFEQGKHGAVEYAADDVLRYTPEPEFTGVDSFEYELSDGWTTVQGTVTIHVLQPAVPIVRAVFSKSLSVPGAGGGRVPERAQWLSFGQPSTDLEGHLAFSARLVSQAGLQSGVFGPTQSAELGVIALSGEPAPGFDSGAQFVAFEDPSIARFAPAAESHAGSAVAFTATVFGPGVTKRDDLGLWTTATADGSLQLVLREGASLPVEGMAFARVQNIQSFSLTQTGLWIVARLTKGDGAVTRRNDVVLLYWDGSTLQLHLREGDQQIVDGKPKIIRTLSALVPARGGAGALRNYDETNGAVLCRVTFTDGTQALTDGSTLVATNDPVGDAAPGGRWARFGMPALAAGIEENGRTQLAFVGEMRIGAGGVRSTNDSGIFVANTALGVEKGEFLVRQNDRVPGLPSLRFVRFKDPVISPGARVAFIASLAGRGVSEKNRDALFWSVDDSLRVLAREGDAAPGAPEAFVDALTAVALPYSDVPSYRPGPVFEAKLRSGSMGFEDGLWTVDSKGMLQLVLRSGADIDVGGEMKRLYRFSMLRALDGSPAKGRALDGSGHIVGLGAFSDGSQAILRITLP